MIPALLTSLLLLTPSADAARLKVSTVTASSTYPEEEGVRYDARQVVDGKAGTAWVEGEDGSGLGSWIELDLGGEKNITEIRVWGGFWYSYSWFTKANRPKDLEVKWSDGSTDTLHFEDEMVAGVLKLDAAKTTSTVRLRIKSIHSGKAWFDTAISEVQVFDDVDSGVPAPSGYASSSDARADADGSYEAFKVGDGIADTMWCEGTSGDGAGQWLEVRLPSAAEVSSIKLINGIGGAKPPTWKKGNRATKATLRFSDGATEQVTIKDFFMPQTVKFTPHTTTSLKITFDGIVKGTEYNDLCISELELY